MLYLALFGVFDGQSNKCGLRFEGLKINNFEKDRRFFLESVKNWGSK